MTPPGRKTTVVLRGKSVALLASPLRMEIIQAFGRDDALTVQEAAWRLGRPQESLYYHVRMLVRAGVLEEVDRRLKGKRYESVYRVRAPRIAVKVDASSKAGRDASARLVASMLRTASREHRAALEEGRLKEGGMLPVGRRLKVWLDDAELAKLNRLLDRMERFLARCRRKPGGKPYAVTTLVVPVREAPS